MNYNNAQRTQNRLLGFLGLIGTISLCALGYYVVKDDLAPTPKMVATVLPSDKTNPQDVLLMRLEAERAFTDEKVNFLKDAALDQAKNEEKRDQEITRLRNSIETMRREHASSQNSPVIQQVVPETLHSDPFSPQVAFQEPAESRIRAPLVELTVPDKPRHSEKVRHVDEVIPAGTSVKAILISSVDMPCGVFNASDPQPVKLRLVDDGRLPKKVRAKLKGAILIASAHGDLSNERIYMRLERLTQVHANGNFVETGVAGFVTGEDGKYGLKGCVVDKSYQMVGNAALSGFFSSLGQYMQATAARGCNIYEPVCNSTATDLASSCVSGGANSAFDMLTNYYIRRAEQIRPVIKAAAGRIVDVTFLHSAELGDLNTQEHVKQVREESQEMVVRSSHKPTGDSFFLRDTGQRTSLLDPFKPFSENRK